MSLRGFRAMEIAITDSQGRVNVFTCVNDLCTETRVMVDDFANILNE